MRLYDGRDLAQNGWFVLRTVIPPGKTHDAVVWNIRPHYIAHWIQPPMIAHSQVGYSAALRKVAVIQLDPRFAAPKTAELLRLSTHGSFRRVYTAPVGAPMHWLRYDYVKFNFSAVRKPGLYEIEYAGHRSDAFPIAPNVYTHTWQTTLDGFLAVQMDHVSVRD
ncbi:glycoside hydrolase family 9 domain protein, partial [mine drainage metagenome]